MDGTSDYDICIIGGGINGAGIARDAAGRGLSVVLVEAMDIAGATSSASSKLVHGGLRYLEQGEFHLVRESLREREILLKIAPHIVHPMTFVMPHDATLRPAWMIRFGLWLYDHIGGKRTLPASAQIDFNTDRAGDPLKKDFGTGFAYADCRVDDARLVALNVLDARERGADILTRAAVLNIAPRVKEKGWRMTVADMASGDQIRLTARAVVNAAGPWVQAVLDASELGQAGVKARLVKGSHIIVPRLHDGPQAYILPQPDRRVVFALPYEGKFTLIGTTDMPFDGDPTGVAITDDEVTYLCNAVNCFFEKQIAPGDIVHTYSGVRSLYDDGAKNLSKVTRDYKLVLDKSRGAPLLSVFGGKLTTYRHLADDVMNKLMPLLNVRRRAWTHKMPLPGGDMGGLSFEDYAANRCDYYPFLPPSLVWRYARAYGSRMDVFIRDSGDIGGLGRHFGDDVYEAEIIYLIVHEFARAVDDILWRRSKLGLHIGDDTRRALESAFPQLLAEYMNNA